MGLTRRVQTMTATPWIMDVQTMTQRPERTNTRKRKRERNIKQAITNMMRRVRRTKKEKRGKKDKTDRKKDNNKEADNKEEHDDKKDGE